MKRFWAVRAAAGDPKVGEVYIYGQIVSYRFDESDVTAQSFKEDLDALGDINTLNVYINSPGGNVWQGQAIYTILRRYRSKAAVNVFVDGLAASIASVIACAGDRVIMPRNAMMMIHNPWTVIAGNAAELRKAADDLDKMRVTMVEAYLAKAGTKITEAKLDELMNAETWLTAQECYDYGFCDEVAEEKEIAACAGWDLLARYRNTPAELMRERMAPAARPLSEAERQERIAAAQENLRKIKSVLEVL